MSEILEAIERLKYLSDENLHVDDINALELSISALEKQIPKKAEYHHKAYGKFASVICPNCEDRLMIAEYIFPLDRYCKKCGQHYVVDILDWSTEE